MKIKSDDVELNDVLFYSVSLLKWTLIQVLEYHINWFEATGFSADQVWPCYVAAEYQILTVD